MVVFTKQCKYCYKEQEDQKKRQGFRNLGGLISNTDTEFKKEVNFLKHVPTLLQQYREYLVQPELQ
jgi:hypothetical protein